MNVFYLNLRTIKRDPSAWMTRIVLLTLVGSVLTSSIGQANDSKSFCIQALMEESEHKSETSTSGTPPKEAIGSTDAPFSLANFDSQGALLQTRLAKRLVDAQESLAGMAKEAINLKKRAEKLMSDITSSRKFVKTGHLSSKDVNGLAATHNSIMDIVNRIETQTHLYVNSIESMENWMMKSYENVSIETRKEQSRIAEFDPSQFDAELRTAHTEAALSIVAATQFAEKGGSASLDMMTSTIEYAQALTLKINTLVQDLLATQGKINELSSSQP